MQNELSLWSRNYLQLLILALFDFLSFEARVCYRPNKSLKMSPFQNFIISAVNLSSGVLLL